MSVIKNHNEELYHYGVLGMKWGVRKGRTKEAYTKAATKMRSYDDKIIKQQKKANKAMTKADKKAYSWWNKNNPDAVREARRKANKKQAKVGTTMRKGVTWYNHMKTTFEKTNVKLERDIVDQGERYIKILTDRSTDRLERIYR